jgi:hypothetical protein
VRVLSPSLGNSIPKEQESRRKWKRDIQVSAAKAVAVFPFLVFVTLTFFPHDPACWGELTATIQSESINQLPYLTRVEQLNTLHSLRSLLTCMGISTRSSISSLIVISRHTIVCGPSFHRGGRSETEGS